MKNPFARFAPKRETARSPNVTPVGVIHTQQYEQSWIPLAYLPRKHEQRMGGTRNLDPSLFKYYPLNDILDILRHSQPETSYAIWQFLRVANSGVEFDAKKITGEHNDRGQRVLDQILWRLNHPPNSGRFEQAKGMELTTGQLLLNVMMRGGCSLENVLNQAGKLDRMQVFDAGTVYFQSRENRLVPHQRQTAPGTGYVEIDYPTIHYQPIDPDTDDPYGSPPMASLIQIIVFQIQFMNDLMAVVHRAGYPRVTGTLIEEAFSNQLPESVKQDPDKYKEATDNYLRQVQDTLRNLKPDDYLIGWDTLKMGLLGEGSSTTIKVDATLKVIEQSMAAALKTLSTILGRGENTSKESYSAEMKLYSRGIESVQKVVEAILERALTQALNLEGIQGWVDVKFKTVDLRSDYQIIAEIQTFQDVLYAARDEGDISDEERTKMMREKFGLVGKPDGWEEMQVERKKSRETGTAPQRRHGSPPATQ